VKKIVGIFIGLLLSFNLFASYRVVKVKNIENLVVKKGEKIIMVQPIYKQDANILKGTLYVDYYQVILETPDDN